MAQFETFENIAEIIETGGTPAEKQVEESPEIFEEADGDAEETEEEAEPGEAEEEA